MIAAIGLMERGHNETVAAAPIRTAALAALGRFNGDRPVRLLGVRAEFAPDPATPPGLRPAGLRSAAWFRCRESGLSLDRDAAVPGS